MGYTKTYDRAIKTLGLRDGFVLCLVYRHCHMKDGKFSASIPRRAQSLGIGRNTLRRALHKLRDAGYLNDLTPDLTHEPHDYNLTEQGLALMDSQLGSPRTGVPERESQYRTPQMGDKEYLKKSTKQKSTSKKKSSSTATAADQLVLVEERDYQNLGLLDIVAQQLLELGINPDIKQKRNAPLVTQGKTPAEVLMLTDEGDEIAENLARWASAYREGIELPWSPVLIWWKICEGQTPPEPEQIEAQGWVYEGVLT